jgi:hypothetical protein
MAMDSVNWYDNVYSNFASRAKVTWGRPLCVPAVFIASDQPPVLVPWDETAPAFNVVPVREREQIVRQQFSLVHTVYAGAHTRCGCGFLDDPDPAAAARSRAALLQYLELAAATGPVELFVCWEGIGRTACRSCNPYAEVFMQDASEQAAALQI